MFAELISWGCFGFDRKILCYGTAFTGSRCPPLYPSSANILANSTDESARLKNYLAAKFGAFAPSAVAA